MTPVYAGVFIVGKTVRCAPLQEKTKSLRPKEMERQVLFMNGLAKSIADNLAFFLEFLGIVVLIFAVALIIQKVADKKNGRTQKIFTTRMMAVTGMLSAISVILYMLDFPLPFLAPGHYKLDFSELPVMIGSFAFGPVAGVLVEFCKVVLKIIIKGTDTAFVGDLANFTIGCSLLLPASLVYEFKKTKKSAILGCVLGTVCITLFGTALNAWYLLPKYAEMYGIPLDALIAGGTAINPAITSLTTYVCFAVAPINIIKGGVVSLLTMLIYKPLSPILKTGHR